jgi:hypothetical protein
VGGIHDDLRVAAEENPVDQAEEESGSWDLVQLCWSPDSMGVAINRVTMTCMVMQATASKDPLAGIIAVCVCR